MRTLAAGQSRRRVCAREAFALEPAAVYRDFSRAADGSTVANYLLRDALAGNRGSLMKTQIRRTREHLEGRVLVPALLWMAGAPLGLVVVLWLFFFRGR
jgi:hypothetical protein